MKNVFSIMASLAVLASTPKSQACFFNCKKEVDKKPEQTLHVSTTESAQQAEEIRQALLELQNQMQAKFAKVEADLNAGDTETAITEAKQILDTVRVKTGIDPKIRIRKSFLVTATFPSGARGMSNLDEATREQVIRTIADFRGGLYMDLMNLSKRTSLLYIRALKAEMIKHGGLTDDDRKKIIYDLVNAALVPMPVEDKAGKKIIVFDQDVANDDHTYLFNRELKMFVIQDADLKLTEKVFDEYLAHKKSSILGMEKPTEPQYTKEELDAFACMARARAINYTIDENAAKIVCFDKYYAILPTFDSCSRLAKEINYTVDENRAKMKCFNKFSN